ncbi:hypothetical protein [Flavobacterium sp.]|uniref:hypothetical protein n=1 Tax=Flavobacterium sp. TaxID=239 RepID=UPI0035B10E2B
MNLKHLESRLKRKNATELKYLLMDVCSKFPEAKDYLDIITSTNKKETKQNLISLEKTYKTKFTKYLCPNILEDDLDLEKAINHLLSIRKSNINTKLTIKCELFFINCCKDFIVNYGYFDEDLYNTMEEIFKQSSKSIFENFLQNEFKEEIENLIQFGNEYGLEFD